MKLNLFYIIFFISIVSALKKRAITPTGVNDMNSPYYWQISYWLQDGSLTPHAIVVATPYEVNTNGVLAPVTADANAKTGFRYKFDLFTYKNFYTVGGTPITGLIDTKMSAITYDNPNNYKLSKSFSTGKLTPGDLRDTYSSVAELEQFKKGSAYLLTGSGSLIGKGSNCQDFSNSIYSTFQQAFT